jgi:hypothetical protein
VKPSNRSKSLAPLLITLFAFTAVSASHASDARNCSTTSVAGKFGFTTTGSIPAIGPVAATGVFTQDRSGTITGAQTRSLNGDIADETFTGTATVNPDCTGTDTLQVFEGGVLVRTTTLHVVYDEDGEKPARSSLLSCCPTGPSFQASLLSRPEEYSLENQTSNGSLCRSSRGALGRSDSAILQGFSNDPN